MATRTAKGCGKTCGKKPHRSGSDDIICPQCSATLQPAYELDVGRYESFCKNCGYKLQFVSNPPTASITFLLNGVQVIAFTNQFLI